MLLKRDVPGIELQFYKPENKGLHAFHGKIAHVASMTFMYYCETHKTVNTRNIKECYCVARHQPITRETTRPQTATVISLWFWVLLAYPELYWAVYKSGTGTRARRRWNACVGTNIRDVRRRTWEHQVWDAGMYGTGTRDIKYIQGCGDVKYGEAGDVNDYFKSQL